MPEQSFALAELLSAMNNKVIVSVYYCPEDCDTCATGYVLDVTKEGLTLEHFTKNGAPDGKVVVRMDRVFMVDVNGEYEKKIAFLAKHYDQVFV